MKGRNKDFQVAGIRTLLKNYGITFDVIDVVAEVDSTLTFGENWNAIKRKYQVCKNVEMS
jgi:galactitol-specific phosphotransferase system IIC component